MQLIDNGYLALIRIMHTKKRGEVLKLGVRVMVKMPDDIDDFFLLHDDGEEVFNHPGFNDFALKFLVDDGDELFLRGGFHHSMPYLFNMALYSAESRRRSDSVSTRC